MKKGFTLVELLVVVAILGILAAVGIVSFGGFLGSSKENAVKSNFNSVTKYVETELMKCDLGMETAIAFLIGAFTSVMAGYSGMRSATSANGRTAMAAKNGGQSEALLVSFNGGAVMGLAVGGLGLLGVSSMYLWLGDDFSTVGSIAGFGMGASSIALFARVGGGIYTKAADVGADLVGKVEAGIPEDDPRNPGVIADNVGDNVGDVAGMGADIFESFVGSIIAAMVIAAAAGSAPGSAVGAADDAPRGA